MLYFWGWRKVDDNIPNVQQITSSFWVSLSEYYFPLFEEALAKQNVPLEIKYLAVVESALNPKAVSRMGATGLWQFMYQTGKQYGLNICISIIQHSPDHYDSHVKISMN